jgi:hypothetical protein
MTSERAEAYGRLMRRLRGLGATGLLPQEEEQIREAADALLFCNGDWTDEHARRSLAAAVRLVEGLVHVGRWAEGDAKRLVRDLESCGPLTPVTT